MTGLLGGRLTAAASLMPCQILMGLNLDEACMLQKTAYPLGLIVAMLEQQPSRICKVFGGIGNDVPNVFQAIAAAGQCWEGFVHKCIQVRVSLCNIRGIRNDEVEVHIHLRIDFFKPVARDELHGQIQL